MRTPVAIVTAGYQGIGRAIADRFVAGGYRVYACDIAAPATDAAGTGVGLLPICLDASSPESVRSFTESICDRGDGVDVLVNNVGIAGPTAAIEDMTAEDWRSVLETNLSSAFYFIKGVLPQMKSRRSGSIINIATTSVKTGMVNRAPYIASKGGLIALSYSLAREVGPFGVRSNVISPGVIDNERGQMITRRIAATQGISVEEAEAQILSHVSMRSKVAPAEVADMAYFLASDAGRHITGQNIGVCGNVEWEP